MTPAKPFYSAKCPPPDEHALGGYTTWRARSSCLAEDAEPRCAKEMLALLEKAWTARG